MIRHKLIAGLALVAGIAVVAPAFGQGSSNGTFGQRNLGSTLGGSSSSAFGGSSLGNSGSFGSGSSSMGSSGSSGLQGLSGGQVTGNERFVRGARQPGQFVGGSTDGGMVGQQNAAANAMGGMNSMGRGGASQLGGLFGNQNMNQLRNMQNMQSMQGGQQRRALRTPIRLGFDRPLPASPQVTAAFAQRLTKIPQVQVTGPLKVTMEGSTAVLRGVVGSERDRDLAARLALLEPGIADVRNELQVRPAVPLPPTAEDVPNPTAQVTPPVND